jgi:hypothetical protein
LIARRKAHGDGGLEALRILKRRLSDAIYQALSTDVSVNAGPILTILFRLNFDHLWLFDL